MSDPKVEPICPTNSAPTVAAKDETLLNPSFNKTVIKNGIKINKTLFNPTTDDNKEKITVVMIKNFLITGDTHGRVMERLSHMENNYAPQETALIILGDAGINFYLNKTDAKNKKVINNTGYFIYCVRGNHEERPENIPTMYQIYDENVEGRVYYEIEYPNIRYLIDGHTYLINKHPTLVIGGAYSVDKWYRLSHFAQDA